MNRQQSAKQTPHHMRESAHILACQGQRLIAISHRPPDAPSAIGLIIVVGGPQYRVGAHRSFVTMARDLSDHGVPVLRFDCRGMGDSEGENPGFEALDDDIHLAIDWFFDHQPALQSVVLCGLCDGASAAAFHAHRDARISGLILMNPWVRTESSHETALIKHYYAKRLFHRDFWSRLIRGQVNLGEFPALLYKKLRGLMGTSAGYQSQDDLPLPERLVGALAAFSGRIMLVKSGHDLVAREFEKEAESLKLWQSAIKGPKLTSLHLPQSDHTFSEPGALDDLIAHIKGWMKP
ncbi:exosortase A system-associated hydrolase 1 [alpha proteobacterium Q-1]|nr:exosortase A system-associated hydrolase 1 [alpha proteobacterium Q-1]